MIMMMMNVIMKKTKQTKKTKKNDDRARNFREKRISN